MTLFRKYLADLGEYLSKHIGICVYDNIVVHLLWADDLVLLLDTAAELQTRLDGLLQFCWKMLIVKEMKIKVMVFGNGMKSEFYFNDIQAERVDKYKYLGVIIHSTNGSKWISSHLILTICVTRHDEPYLAYTEKRSISALYHYISHVIFIAVWYNLSCCMGVKS